MKKSKGKGFLFYGWKEHQSEAAWENLSFYTLFVETEF